MSNVQAALDAMAAAEREARYFLEFTWAEAWITIAARDRVALVARDRATLQRHEKPLAAPPDECGCGNGHDWPCPDARAVVEFWTKREDA